MNAHRDVVPFTALAAVLLILGLYTGWGPALTVCPTSFLIGCAAGWIVRSLISREPKESTHDQY